MTLNKILSTLALLLMPAVAFAHPGHGDSGWGRVLPQAAAPLVRVAGVASAATGGSYKEPYSLN